MKARAYIAGGHVYCRVERRDMDIEKCFSCTRLHVIADEASPPYVVCDTAGVTPNADDERAFAEWRHEHHQRGR